MLPLPTARKMSRPVKIVTHAGRKHDHLRLGLIRVTGSEGALPRRADRGTYAAGDEVPLRELELARLEQLEAELAADRVRRRVVDIREGVHEAVLVVALGELDPLRGRPHPEPT